jgi:hypothetical protein
MLFMSGKHQQMEKKSPKRKKKKTNLKRQKSALYERQK